MTTLRFNILTDERGGAFDKLANEVDRAHGELVIFNKEGERLGTISRKAAKDVDSLGVGITKTSKASKAASSDVRKMQNATEDASKGFAKLSTNIDDWVKGAPVFGVALAAIGLTFAPVITSLVGGAIIAGGVAGVIGLGIELQKDNPRVKAGATALGVQFKDTFGHASAGLVDPLVGALKILRVEVKREGPEWKAAFTAAGKAIEPIASGLAGLTHFAMPGFVSMLQHAQPVMDVIAKDLPLIGFQLGRTFDKIGQHAPQIAVAVDDLATTLVGAIDAMGNLVAAGADTYVTMRGIVSKIGNLFVGLGHTISDIVTFKHGPAIPTPPGGHAPGAGVNQGGGAPGAGAGANLLGMTNAQAAANARMTASQNTLTASLHRTTAAILGEAGSLEGLRGDQIAAAQSVADATAAIKANGKTLNLHTQEGRDNATAINNIAVQYTNWAKAATDAHEPAARVNAILAEGRRRFIAASTAAGANAAQVKILADRLFGLPASRRTTVTANTAAAQARIRRIQAQLDGLHDRTVTVTTVVRNTSGGTAPGGGVKMARGGWIREHIWGVGASGRRYEFGEGGPERVVPLGRGSGAMGRVTSGAGGTVNHITLVAPNYIGSTDDLVRSLNNLARQGRLDTAVRLAS